MRLRLAWSILTLETRRRMSYRIDFWVTALAGLAVQVAVLYFVLAAMFREGGRDQAGGADLRSLMLYYIVATVIGRIVTVAEFEHAVSQDIYEGALSKYLVYPVTYPVVKFVQQLGAAGPAVIQAALFAGWMPFVFGWPREITPASAAMAAPAVAVAVTLQFLIVWPIQSISFWAENVWSLMVAQRLVSRFLGGLIVPPALFPEWGREAMEFLPFTYLFAFPADVALGRVDPARWATGLGVGAAWCLILAGVGAAVWRRGGLRYSGAGM